RRGAPPAGRWSGRGRRGLLPAGDRPRPGPAEPDVRASLAHRAGLLAPRERPRGRDPEPARTALQRDHRRVAPPRSPRSARPARRAAGAGVALSGAHDRPTQREDPNIPTKGPGHLLTSPPRSPVRRFELVEGKSAKFWQADVSGTIFIVEFGRLGTAGQRNEKD